MFVSRCAAPYTACSGRPATCSGTSTGRPAAHPSAPPAAPPDRAVATRPPATVDGLMRTRGTRAQRRVPRGPPRARPRRLLLPLPRGHGGCGAGDPRAPLRLGREGVVGAAGRQHRALRQGRDRALPLPARRRPGDRLARRGDERLGRPRGRRAPARQGRLRAGDDRRRAAQTSSQPSRRTRVAGSGSASPRRSPRRCWSCAARGSTSGRCAAPRACRSARSPRPPRWRWSTASASRASRSAPARVRCGSSATACVSPRRRSLASARRRVSRPRAGRLHRRAAAAARCPRSFSISSMSRDQVIVSLSVTK